MERLYDLIFRCETNTVRRLCLTAAVFSGTFLLTNAYLKFLRRRKQARNLPPSLGSILRLPQREPSYIFFMEKARELGPVFALNYSNRLAVVINGREMIYEAFVKQSLAFASRPGTFTRRLMNPGSKGFLNHPYDPTFRKYHLLSLNILKKLGFGQGIMESRIQVEVEDLLANIRKLNGEAACADQLLTRSVGNVILSIILGERYDHSSPVLAQLIENAHEFVCVSKDRMILDFLPIIRFLPKYRRCLNRVIKLHDEILKHMRGKIDAGMQGELPESFISHFIQMEGPEFDRDQLLFSLRDFLLAGTETTATTLQWALILLANYPDIQQRLHTEIDSVVSRDRLPSLDDRKNLPFTEAVILELLRIKTTKNLPFTEAVILELLRIKTTVPLALPHETLDDTHLYGYFIPKGSMVLANLYSAHMDPTVWKDPHTFNPERFLDPDGKVTNKDEVISFSLGRRSCLGEILAQQELFLFLTGLVQHLEILPPEGQLRVVYKEIAGVTLVPTDYKTRLLPRCN